MFFGYWAVNGFPRLDTGSADHTVAVISIDEKITDEYAARLIGRIEKIKEREDTKAILLNFASPGGSPSASDEIAQYLKAQSEEIPITYYIGSMAASGGYFIASVADHLMANPQAVVGSIGVIMPIVTAEGLTSKVGIKEHTLVAGSRKQAVSWFKTPTEETKQYLQDNLLQPVYQNFLAHVAKHRDMNISELTKYSEGQIWLASEVEHILVDEITHLYKVKADMKKKLQEQYPGKEIGFVDATPKRGNMPFGVEIDIKSDVLDRLLTYGPASAMQ